jgi:hypothetical protein
MARAARGRARPAHEARRHGRSSAAWAAAGSTLLPSLPADRRQELADSLGAGGAHVAGRVRVAVEDAYVSALNNRLRIAAVVALLGAVLSWLLIADRVTAPAGAPASAPAVAERALETA